MVHQTLQDHKSQVCNNLTVNERFQYQVPVWTSNTGGQFLCFCYIYNSNKQP